MRGGLLALFVFTLAILCAQTRVDGPTQVHGLGTAATPAPDPQPQPGVNIICEGARCLAYPDGSFATFQVAPPTGPGTCPSYGGSVFAVDPQGYVYVCRPPEYAWRRSPQPWAATW